jgi:hypothetical protein
MLKKTIRLVTWIGDRIEDLLSHFARNYARDLLAAQGLADIEVGHVWKERQHKQQAEAINSEI